MSDLYIRRRERVFREFEATRDALDYVKENWQRQSISLNAPRNGFSDLLRAADALEEVHLLRLFSRFEGLLKEHLAEHHPGIVVPEEARAVWLMDRVAQRQAPAISATLRGRVHEVRRYRNQMTHPGRLEVPPIPILAALVRLSKFVDYLPEPRL